MIDFLTKRRTTGSLLVLALLAGVIYVFVTLNLNFIIGKGTFWVSPRGPWLTEPGVTPENLDIIDYLIGYTGFVHEPWHLPLFYVAKIGAPAGTNVVFLDVIPIVAVFGKIIYQITGYMILPYGTWIAMCFVLSAVFATLLVVELGQRSFITAAAASALAVSAPPLLYRFGHFPLFAHFLVIGSLYLYFLSARRPLSWVVIAAWMAWLVLALLVNVYMLFMCGMVYLATLSYLSRTADWRRIVTQGGSVGGLLLIVMLIAGHIGPGTGSSPFASGFGYYSMNLASPFWPQFSGMFPSLQNFVFGTGGQYEGFNYLGFGGLLMVFGGCVLTGPRLPSLIGRHRDLAQVLALLTLLALSNVVYFGRFKILDLNVGYLLDRILGTFRSSGRLFWPVYYLILLGGMVLLARRLPPRLQVLILVAFCGLQLVDTEPLRNRLAQFTVQSAKPVADPAEWSARVTKASAVEIYPTFFCSAVDKQAVNIELQLISIRSGRPFNSVYNPRLISDCTREARTSKQGPWRNDTLYIYLAPSGSAGSDTWLPPGLSCHAFLQGHWCLGPSENGR